MRRGFDSIAVVEAAYRMGASDADWLADLSRASAPGLDQGLGVATCFWRLSETEIDPRTVNGEVDPALLALIPRTYAGLPAGFVARAFSGPPWVERVSDHPEIHGLLMKHVAEHRRLVGDVVAGQVGDGLGRGLTIGAFAPEVGKLEPTRKHVWVRVMTHVGAALRLRGRLEDTGELPRDAVLDPEGRVHHAEGAVAAHTRARLALVDAVRRMEKARGRARRTDPEAALASWRALVDGTWSLVEWLDTDGRRYLVAHENRLTTRDPRALSPREREVAEYMLFGRSNAEIAYALGLAEPTINKMARDVLRKLGGVRRTELAAIFAAPAVAQLEQGVHAIRAMPLDDDAWARLGPAQREVASMAIGGRSNEEIARARGRSARTVANQLAQIYARLGVRGRSELAAVLGGAAPPSE